MSAGSSKLQQGFKCGMRMHFPVIAILLFDLPPLCSLAEVVCLFKHTHDL